MNNRNNTHKSNKDKMQNVNGISTPTRKWLVALGMIQDVQDYCRITYNEICNEGYPLKNHDEELNIAIKGVKRALFMYLNEQINISILGIGDDNVSNTSKI